MHVYASISTISAKAVYSMLTAIIAYGADSRIIVTTSTYSKAAIKLAKVKWYWLGALISFYVNLGDLRSLTFAMRNFVGLAGWNLFVDDLKLGMSVFRRKRNDES